MIIINFKSYRQSSGEKGLQLAEICQRVSKEPGIEIIPCVQTADLALISSKLDIPVWAQHFDLKKPEKNTGWVTASSLKQAGAEGVLINHSEHPEDSKDVQKYVSAAKENDLKTLVFASDLDQALEFDQLNPDYLFLETPKLIAKEAMAHFEKEREKIRKFVKQVKSFPMVGAGIANAEDVRSSLELGAKGIGLASAFVLADDPEKVLRDIALGFK
jgi:triosephosphate isomerase